MCVGFEEFGHVKSSHFIVDFVDGKVKKGNLIVIRIYVRTKYVTKAKTTTNSNN